MPPNPLGLALRHRRAGHDKLLWADPQLQAPENLTLSSPAFSDGQPIPERHRGRLLGHNVSPALEWSAPPDGTVQLALIVEDPDVPVSVPGIHAVAVGIAPEVRGIPEDGMQEPSPVAGIRYGRGALGRRGWAGPLPPGSHGPHDYVFQLYALDLALSLGERFGGKDVAAAMAGHVIGRARLTGTYER